MSDDIVINVSKWMREHVNAVEPDIQPGERECLAYTSMLLYKMFLLGQGRTYKWSDSFKKYLVELPKQFDELVW